MLQQQCGLAYKTFFREKRLDQSYAGIECEIMHRHGPLKYVPGYILRIG